MISFANQQTNTLQLQIKLLHFSLKIENSRRNSRENQFRKIEKAENFSTKNFRDSRFSFSGKKAVEREIFENENSRLHHQSLFFFIESVQREILIHYHSIQNTVFKLIQLNSGTSQAQEVGAQTEISPKITPEIHNFAF